MDFSQLQILFQLHQPGKQAARQQDAASDLEGKSEGRFLPQQIGIRSNDIAG